MVKIRRRVLYITSFPYGTPGNSAHKNIPLFVHRHGYDVAILAPGQLEPLSEPRIEFMDWKKHNLRRKLRGISSAIQRFAPDLVHVFFDDRDVALYPLVSKLSPRGPRYLLDIRSPLLTTGWRRTIGRAVGPLYRILYDGVAAHEIHSAHTVVGARRRVHTLPPGVDIDLFKDYKPPYFSPGEQLRIVYIGSISRKRNMGWLVSELLAVPTDYPLVVDIIGDGNDKERLKDIVNRHGYQERIRFLGYMPQDRIARELPNYHVGLGFVPSGPYEFAPALKTLEYMASGLPVLASDTAGNRIYLKESFNGVSFSLKDGELGECLMRIFREGYGRSLSHGARLTAEEHSWARIVDEYLLPVYQQL